MRKDPQLIRRLFQRLRREGPIEAALAASVRATTGAFAARYRRVRHRGYTGRFRRWNAKAIASHSNPPPKREVKPNFPLCRQFD
jgi:hypothetical protein